MLRRPKKPNITLVFTYLLADAELSYKYNMAENGANKLSTTTLSIRSQLHPIYENVPAIPRFVNKASDTQ